MAKTIAGEVRLKVGNCFKTLRLDIGTMMELEDHFDMGLVPFLNERLPEFRLGDLACLYAAMTGADFRNEDTCREAAKDLVTAGLSEAATQIAQCLKSTLMPDIDAPRKSTKTTKKK